MARPIYTPMPQAQPEEPAEAPVWQYDKWGKKYRKIGNCIEYAPTVTVDGIEVYQDELEEHNRRNREAKKRMQEEENRRMQQQATGKVCPLQDPLHFQTKCRTDCAMYTPTGCTMKHRPAQADTKGRPCPYMRTCQECCALYDQGCTI